MNDEEPKGKSQPISFELNEHDERFIQSLVESGRYESPVAVIEAALTLLMEQESE